MWNYGINNIDMGPCCSTQLKLLYTQNLEIDPTGLQRKADSDSKSWRYC